MSVTPQKVLSREDCALLAESAELLNHRARHLRQAETDPALIAMELADSLSIIAECFTALSQNGVKRG